MPVSHVLPRTIAAPVSKAVLQLPVPPGMLLDYPIDEFNDFLAMECVYVTPEPVPAGELPSPGVDIV